MKNSTLDSPKKTRLHIKWLMNLDHLDIDSLRDQIYEMYKNKKIVCLESIHKRVRDIQLFEGYKASFHTLLQGIRFKWCKDNHRRNLMELPDIALKIIQFLKA
ncbi:uncharacterized protein LOC143204337 [Rhynchophorus ferrugineus]|uniref:uncharacterized protein LOC143204337 n=1 Tax=Rhynchophorus ferrugineus TaxID=354439 RepID=UPI003FCEBAB2